MPAKVTYTALIFRSIQYLATYLFLVGRTRYCQLLETCVQLWVCRGKLTRSQPNPGQSPTLSLGCWLGLSVGCSWYVSDINQGYLWVVQPPGSPVCALCPACDKHKAGLCSKLWEWSKPSPNLGGVAGMMSILFTQDKAILKDWEGKREDPDARTCIYIFFSKIKRNPKKWQGTGVSTFPSLGFLSR